ncbi:MAG: hypothetical protein M3Z00_00075, partial [Actinomycetota bacterium]|nr:hypothetical protein [Actinomycetota bacterium]
MAAVALAAAIAEMLAAAANWFGLLTDSATPVGSLGEAFIAIAPNGLVDWAKNTLGSPGDKIFLGVGIGVTLLAGGALIGIAGRHRRMVSARLLLLLGVIPGAAIVTRRGAGLLDLVPLAVGLVTGCWLLLAGFRARTTHHAGPAAPTVAAQPTPKPIAASAAGDVREPSGKTEPRDRRRVLQMAGYGALGAVISGVLSRLIPAHAATDASRAGVTLPTAPPQTTEPPSAGPASGAAASSAGPGTAAAATAPTSAAAPLSSVYIPPPSST